MAGRGPARLSGPDETAHCPSACSGVGKTIVKAIIGWNFLTCYVRGRDHPYGLATSVDAANLSSTLWKELANCRERSRFCSNAFEMNSERIYERQNPLTWRLEARTWSKKADSDAQGRTLSGLHAKFILYLIDECGDINPAVLRAAEQGLSNCEFGKIVVGGNPSSHAGILYFVVKEQPHLWTIIPVTADPDDPNRVRGSIQTGRGRWCRQFGRTNPWVMYAILGRFPPVGVNALFGPDEVADAMKRHVLVDAYAHAQTRIGIDVARSGMTARSSLRGRDCMQPAGWWRCGTRAPRRSRRASWWRASGSAANWN